MYWLRSQVRAVFCGALRTATEQRDAEIRLCHTRLARCNQELAIYSVGANERAGALLAMATHSKAARRTA